MNLLYPIIAVLSAFISFLTLTPPVQNINNEYKTTLGAALPQGVAVFETSLQSAITNTADTMTLVSNSVRGGSSLSGYNCFTIDEGRADAEFACGTISGTTVSGLKRGIDPLSGTSTNATLQFAHRRGASVKVTDFPLIQVMRNQLSGNERFDNLLLYSTTSEVCGPGSATGTICGKQYIDNLAIGSAVAADDTTQGFVEMATVSEASSTASLGGTGARLAVGSNLVSATPGVSLIPMTQTTGKLLQGWLDLTKMFRFDGGIFVSASSTFVATTTFSVYPQYHGSGQDGDVTATAGATTTLTRDMFYSNFTIPVGATVTPAGYKIYVKNTLTVDGLIDLTGGNGGNASGQTKGSASVGTPDGTLKGGAAGGAGSNGGDYLSGGGTAGTGSTSLNSMLGAGVTGTTGNSGSNCGTPISTPGAGGAAGTMSRASTTATTTNMDVARLAFDWNGLFGVRSGSGGAGGGGGSQSAGGTACGVGGGGGGAGANGGFVWISAKDIIISSTGIIQANGGNGGNGGQCSGNSTGASGNGGNGGGGGMIWIFYSSLSNSGTVQTRAGSGGTQGGGSCVAGSNGSTGITGVVRYF